jgi:hypothetical protein
VFEGREEGCVARQAVEARRSSGDVELLVDGTKVAVAVIGHKPPSCQAFELGLDAKTPYRLDCQPYRSKFFYPSKYFVP